MAPKTDFCSTNFSTHQNRPQTFFQHTKRTKNVPKAIGNVAPGSPCCDFCRDGATVRLQQYLQCFGHILQVRGLPLFQAFRKNKMRETKPTKNKIKTRQFVHRICLKMDGPWAWEENPLGCFVRTRTHLGPQGLPMESSGHSQFNSF